METKEVFGCMAWFCPSQTSCQIDGIRLAEGIRNESIVYSIKGDEKLLSVIKCSSLFFAVKWLQANGLLSGRWTRSSLMPVNHLEWDKKISLCFCELSRWAFNLIHHRNTIYLRTQVDTLLCMRKLLALYNMHSICSGYRTCMFGQFLRNKWQKWMNPLILLPICKLFTFSIPPTQVSFLPSGR